MTEHEHDDMEGLWIRTEPSEDGKTYIVTCSYDGDFAFTLTPTRATAYAVALLGACAEAEYDHAVMRLCTERLKLAPEVAVQLVKDLRGERPERIASGLVFEPIVGYQLDAPLVNIWAMDRSKQYGQWTLPSARRHAMHVFEAPGSADLDASFYRILRASVGVAEHVARNVIDDLQNYRVGWEVSDE